MYTIPVEILLEIGRTDLETYKGMLAIPKFARAVSIGYRLDVMADDIWFVRDSLPNLKSRVNFSGKLINTIISRQQSDMNVFVTMVDGCGSLSIWGSYSHMYYENDVIMCNCSIYDEIGGRLIDRQDANKIWRITCHGKVC